MFTRKKMFVLDGVEIAISPLTAVQVEEHLSAEAQIVEDFEKAKTGAGSVKDVLKRQEALMLSLVCAGINNAVPESKMTGERLRAEADNVLIGKLQGEIMELSGLKIVSPESPPGEG